MSRHPRPRRRTDPRRAPHRRGQDFDGLRREVCLAYTPEAGLGDYVIVHVGLATSLVYAQEAARTLAVLRAIPDALATELGATPPATGQGAAR